MKYMCFCYYDPQKVANLPPEQMEAIPNECKPHDDALNASGKRTYLGVFSEPDTWKTIRPVDGRPSVSDGGMYPDNRDQIGVFFVVEADDIDEAVRIASLHPGAHLGKFFGGGIEVRACEMWEDAPATTA